MDLLFLCSIGDERRTRDIPVQIGQVGEYLLFGKEQVMQKDIDRDRQHGKSAARDQTEGNIAETKGRLKESWSALTDNERLRAEGRSDQVAGARQRTKGQWKQRIKAWIGRM
jgi:uncharacterized protein YjbJ (UPF0337 family)